MRYTVLESLSALTPAAYAAGYAAMAPARRAKCDAYRFDDDKKRCVLADILVRRELSSLTGLPPEQIGIRLSDAGKPFVDFPGVFFSVSHSGALVGAAFADREVGFDLERVRPVPARTAKAFCTDADRRYIFGETPAPETLTDSALLRRFFEVWTCKEALAKLTGEGFTERLRTVDLDPAAAFEYPPGFVVCTLTAGGSGQEFIAPR